MSLEHRLSSQMIELFQERTMSNNTKLFTCLLVSIAMVDALSFLSKVNLHNFEELKKQRNGELSMQFKSCTDAIDEKVCKSFERLCDVNSFLKEKCRKTCKLCQKMFVQPKCDESVYRCCWDNVTVAIGPQKLCPPCIDRNKDECSVLAGKCGEAAIRRTCPETCKVTCERCEDDEHQAETCPMFRMIGACETDQKLMKKYCKKTCKFC